VADLLEDEGHAVLRAYNGAETLAQLERDGLDLLITDNMMPRLSGVELIAHLHTHPDLAVPVILMSAVTPVQMPPQVTFLPKPFNIDHLATLVSQLLGGG
jgi:CheY-like chemotaxis protein